MNWTPLHFFHKSGRQAQILIMFAILLVVLILFSSLVIDGGNIYITKAELSKAVDAAALAGVRNLYQGDDVASAVIRDTFTANYHGGGNLVQSPTMEITFTTSNNSRQINLAATAVLNTYFIRLIPRFATFPVSQSAQATRTKLILALALDRSGSMVKNDGATALPPAVRSFVSMLDERLDSVGMVSFASNVATNVPIQSTFKTSIYNSLDAMVFSGATYSDGGLAAAHTMNLSVVVPPTDLYYRVVLFFTDGLANTFQYTWPTNRTYNVGGSDSGTNYFVLRPTDGLKLQWATGAPPAEKLPDFPACPSMTNFISITGTNYTLSPESTRLEGKLRALNTANSIRAAGITIYAVGLGNDIDQEFLKTVANDPSGATWNSRQPPGDAVFAPTAADLQSVFQQIAAKILMRLTQ